MDLQRIDEAIQQLCVPAEAALEAALRDSAEAGLPPINVSPNEGRLLYLLTRLCGAKRVLEIGCLGGYSAIHLGKALPAGGFLLSLELEPKHAEVACRNLARAKLACRHEVRVGPAAELLAKMIKSREPGFDVIFVDADKENYPLYLDYALKLSHSGSLILVDNVIRDGQVFDRRCTRRDIVAIRRCNKLLAANKCLECLLLPILRESVDGLALARVK